MFIIKSIQSVRQVLAEHRAAGLSRIFRLQQFEKTLPFLPQLKRYTNYELNSVVYANPLNENQKKKKEEMLQI